MANTFYTPAQVASVALALVRGDLVLARTVNRDYEAGFGGGRGTVVNVRKPATLNARKRSIGAGTAIQTDSISESTVAVTMTDMIYSAVDLTDEDLSLNLEDFGRQVLAPQVTAVAEEVEDTVVAAFQALAESAVAVAGSYSATNPTAQFVTLRQILRDRKVPATNLTAAVGTGVYADLLNSGALKGYDQSGSTDALRNAEVGKVHGFTIIESNRLAHDEIVAYHRDAFTLAIRAPRVPEGVSFGQSASGDGFAMRYIRDYDSSLLADRSVVSTFIGCQAMNMVEQGTGATVVPAVRVLTSTTA
ncbi:P22 phage major capsid protein family protein [Actinopolymorpha pittospori]|uniref:P22 coat protein-gene protein 5 n=1 Tax=Actinopolymorpha pittospori TaxID=648752 RepID=A0A927N029_9ACTN|nr:P22 phage major capsid protein family protein [Actinopolymorpha pittospori]MBE1606250.1 hypothetical protein [Actinopolymorpha pittospori]